MATALALASTCIASAQREESSRPAVEQRIFRSFLDGDYAAAATLIDEQLQQSPRDVTLLYNGACAYARLGQKDKAADYLFKSVEAGFRDFGHLREDPDLQALHGHDVFEAILEAAERVAAMPRTPREPVVRGSALERWRQTYGDNGYRYEKDEARGLAYATALDETAHQQMRLMLERQADQLTRTLFSSLPPQPAYQVLIAIPTPDHARQILPRPQIGGIYEHDRRRLIARNIGGSLRHEFFHLMHYRHMEQKHQLHRLWVQEGLASLYEDYQLGSGNSIEFTPNERHNRVKGLALAGKLDSWTRLFELSDDAFMLRAPDLYPQVRSIFEFFAARGVLERWYAEYVDHFKQDPSGVRTTELVFGASLSDIERQWRMWVQQRAEIDLQVNLGDAALGVQIEPQASNDGVLIAEIIPGSGASASRLKPGDVIVAFDGQPTPTESELLTLVAARRPGEVVEVRARRGAEYFTTIVTLKPLR